MWDKVILISCSSYLLKLTGTFAQGWYFGKYFQISVANFGRLWHGCGASNDRSTIQRETAGCYTTMKCISTFNFYNILQSNECWSIRQADPPNWLTSANCCTLREMTSILSRKWSNVPRGGERIRHGTWKLLVRWLWRVVWFAPKANKTLRLCSVANSTAGVGQDLVHRYLDNLSTHVLHINTPTGWSTGGMRWHIVFIT